MAHGAVNEKLPQLRILDENQTHTFIIPVKKINEGHDVSAFLTSKAYSDIMTFVLQLNYAMFPNFIPCPKEGQDNIKTWELDDSGNAFSDTVNRLRNLLVDIEAIIDKTPPDPGPRRFGNISFRKWAESVESQSKALLERHLPLQLLRVRSSSDIVAHDELASYLLGSFGSSQRLDYGTGHELSFLAFLGSIWKLGGFEHSKIPGDEERGIVLGVIAPYLQLIRRLIKTYTLEPAGSHGVWGLDDHSFLPYIFGSAQYAPAIRPGDEPPSEGSYPNAPSPADVAKAMPVQRERKKNLYFGAIGFIYDVKKGPFWEHSPMLFDISGVPAGWAKINKGMIKMYNAEVLSKFPVVQHFPFGSLFEWTTDPDAGPPPTSIHTSNQPSKTPFNTPVNIPDSNSTGATTRTPATSALPNPSSGTSAPWARSTNQSTRSTSQIGSSRFPPRQPVLSMNQPALGETSIPSDSMPPPTRAPWAKPP